MNGQYSDPEVFEKEILDFEIMDKKRFPPPDAIVFIGSSSMRGWHPSIEDDLAPLTVIPRGFGGSNMNDALHYVDRIVLPYKPRAVVLYEGDNDIAAGISPKLILKTFRAFVAKVHKSLPEARVYVLSIKPSISRRELWPQMKAANRLLKKECSKDKRLVYVDVASAMLDDEEEPKRHLFHDDDLHMTRAGYEAWRDALRPVLIERELPFESRKIGPDAAPHPSPGK